MGHLRTRDAFRQDLQDLNGILAGNMLKRFDSTSDVKKCANVQGYTHNYFYKTKNETFSFVLCMKLR